jgi:beta-lactamase regulating signal transducer with metallopeptidase domain
MASWSQSQFLQSLGWSTLNSFWQMALLWCIYLAVCSVFKISASKKYQFGVCAIVTGFAWFVFTFIYYFNSSSVPRIAIFNQTIDESNRLFNTFLLSASVAYLSLLVFPSYRLFRNWQFVRTIKKHGLQKAALNYRLFVTKISAQLNITKKVFVYVSNLVTSPVTVGYLKPVILLPVAVLSNLSVQQVEAILLHELSHIRRYDYLVNFIVSIISTFLYFNPFVKQFVTTIEQEREHCCDQLVLQYGYDKVGYASALLTLEKLSTLHLSLALGAAGKNYLFNRIEKIVGLEKKKTLKRNQFASLIAALFCIVVFNSILIIKDKQPATNVYASVDFTSPLNLLGDGASKVDAPIPANRKVETNFPVTSTAQKPNEKSVPVKSNSDVPEGQVVVTNNMIVQVAQDDVESSLTLAQKEQVKTTLAATKKVLGNLQWKEVEIAIADVLTENEKLAAKQQYINELNNIVNWKNVEQNMKAQYENMDWQKIDNKMNNALIAIGLDSLQRTYTIVLNQLNRLTTEVKSNTKLTVSPMPDQSIEVIEKTKEELSNKIDTIKALRNPKKIVRL